MWIPFRFDMKAIKTNLIIGSISSRKDGSLRFSAETPELNSLEKVAWMELQGKSLEALFNPLDEVAREVVEIKESTDLKSPSERLRGVIYVYWKENVNDGDFTSYYHRAMDRIIDKWKEKLDEKETIYKLSQEKRTGLKTS